ASAERSTYIVVLDDSVTDVEATARSLVRGAGGELGFVYQHALKGFSADLTAQAASSLARNPRVSVVEADQEVSIATHTPPPLPTGIDRINADANETLKIDGTDERVTGAVVAVIDTGIDFDHPDLNVNTAKSVNCAGGSPFKASCTVGAGDDDNGHGTHVAGTIGALDNGVNVDGIHVVGVAPGVEQWAVKVLRSDGSGYMSWIVAGIDYVTENASFVDVANMSLGCECSSSAMDTAIENSVAAGVTYAVAAGNSGKDASTFSPANHPDVITVSALADFDGEPGGLASPTCRDDEDDTLANFSNYGSLVEVTAPGVCILSTVPGGYATYSGTSMASPHVAGAAALLVSSDSTLTPPGILLALETTGKTDWTDDSGDGDLEPRIDVADSTVFSPTMDGTGGGGDTNAAPTASFTFSCTDLACDFDGTASSDSDGSISSYAWEFGDGNTGSGATVTHTYGAGGTYTVTLTVSDDDTAIDSDSQDVTVSDGTVSPSPEGTYVGDLDGTATSKKALWNATVWIRVIDVVDGNVTGVDGVVVEGLWDPATGQDGKSTSCTTGVHPVTNEAGWCSVNSGNFAKSTSSVKWTVTHLNGAPYSGAPAGASDPDGDSDLKSITVSKS
ncbi:MAG: S8 family serine peptidase, partial [Acidimicrobiia bacterium]